VADSAAAVVVVTVASPTKGQWIITTRAAAADSTQDVGLQITGQSTTGLEVEFPGGDIHGGGPFLASVRADGAPIPAVTLTGQLSTNDGPPVAVPFADDGLHGDGAAGDGVFGALLAPAAGPGEYVLTIQAEEDSAGSVLLSRSAAGVFQVDALPDLMIESSDVAVTRPKPETDSLAISVTVHNVGSAPADAPVVTCAEFGHEPFATVNVAVREDVDVFLVTE
jgi:hypothetical protein